MHHNIKEYGRVKGSINIINLVTSCQFQAPAEFTYENCLLEPTEEEMWWAHV